jgi:uncharacterized protein (TIGR02246 family)
MSRLFSSSPILGGPPDARRSSRPWWRRLLRRIAWAVAVLIAVAFVAFAVAYVRSDNDCEERIGSIAHDPMKAIVHCDYGTADALRVVRLEKPRPNDNQILVHVRAAAINPLDWHVMRGTPYVMRLMAGLRKPKEIQLGVDFAGTVEGVGTKVTGFASGDRVFGVRDGALAEYLVVSADRGVAPMPAGMTYEQAASLPVAAITALQALRDRAKLQPGQKVLINGASGGVGTFAVQIAKSLGAEVTGVCSTRNLEMVKALGADHVIDYTKEDFTKGSERYDVIMDNVANRGLLECRRALTPKGKFVLVGGGGPEAGSWIGPLAGPIKAVVLSPFISQEMGMFLAQVNKADLSAMGELVASGKVTPVIDRRYSLDEAPEAIRYLEQGHARGKVIIAAPITQADLEELATRYAAAWCSKDPARVAAFFAPRASLTINAGAPSAGREAITEAAHGFMTALPDMVVAMDGATLDHDRAVFRWTLTGTNTGSGGSGRPVRISGFEEWTLGPDGLIADSKGHFDSADYERQLSGKR